jgi:hypothetical protein
VQGRCRRSGSAEGGVSRRFVPGPSRQFPTCRTQGGPAARPPPALHCCERFVPAPDTGSVYLPSRNVTNKPRNYVVATTQAADWTPVSLRCDAPGAVGGLRQRGAARLPDPTDR